MFDHSWHTFGNQFRELIIAYSEDISFEAKRLVQTVNSAIVNKVASILYVRD